MKIRLDKYLSELGIGTRSEVKKFISQGKVKVDNQVVKLSDIKIDTSLQKVFFEGENVVYEKYEYYVLNKPAGVISATKDNFHKTVIDILNVKRKGLAPVGRLDIDTEGLILITNDGELAHNLISPKKHVKKVYEALILGSLPSDLAKQFENGFDIGEDEITMPAKLEIMPNITNLNISKTLLDEIKKRAGNEVKDLTFVKVTIYEGKYHQVKRMFLKFNTEVVFLRRVAMGGLMLEDLDIKIGEYKKLTSKEIYAKRD
jgi:pseudouridylate synthase